MSPYPFDVSHSESTFRSFHFNLNWQHTNWHMSSWICGPAQPMSYCIFIYTYRSVAVLFLYIFKNALIECKYQLMAVGFWSFLLHFNYVVFTKSRYRSKRGWYLKLILTPVCVHIFSVVEERDIEVGDL